MEEMTIMKDDTKTRSCPTSNPKRPIKGTENNVSPSHRASNLRSEIEVGHHEKPKVENQKTVTKTSQRYSLDILGLRGDLLSILASLMLGGVSGHFNIINVVQIEKHVHIGVIIHTIQKDPRNSLKRVTKALKFIHNWDIISGLSEENSWIRCRG